jgi:hypothetical protein
VTFSHRSLGVSGKGESDNSILPPIPVATADSPTPGRKFTGKGRRITPAVGRQPLKTIEPAELFRNAGYASVKM